MTQTKRRAPESDKAQPITARPPQSHAPAARPAASIRALITPPRADTHTNTHTHTHIPREHRPLVSLRVDRCAGGVLHALRASGHAPWPHRAAAASRARRRRAGAPPRARERAPSTPTSLAWSEYGDGRWSGLAARSQRHCRRSRHVRVMWRVCTLEPSSWRATRPVCASRLRRPRPAHPTPHSLTPHRVVSRSVSEF